MNDSYVTGVDRNGEVQKIKISSTEYRFKLALHNKRYNEVKKILESGGLCGNAIVKYLQEKGFPEVALYFVDDYKTRFNLAIEAGIIEIALEAAYKLNEKECWQRLGKEALRQGNAQIVEMAYQKTRNLDRLSILYLITGNLTKLFKMQQIADSRHDSMRLFHTALLRGDIEKRVEMLAEAGHVPLAYITAKTHNLQHMLNGPLEESLGAEQVARLDAYCMSSEPPAAMTPPVPIFNEKEGGDQNWPLHHIITSEFELLKNQTDPANPFAMTAEAKHEEDRRDFAEVGMGATAEAKGWGDELDFEVPEAPQAAGGWGGDDFEVPEVDEAKTDLRTMTAGLTLQQKWAKSCTLPGELIAAGSFQNAMQFLTRTAGIVNFKPLKELFLQIYMAGHVSIPLTPHLVPLDHYSTRLKQQGTNRPLVALSLNLLTTRLKQAYGLTTQAKFADALVQFRQILLEIPLLSVSSEAEENEVKDLIKICVEYITCMRLEIARQESLAAGRNGKALEHAYYMCLCKLQPAHQGLALRSAISLAYKFKNYITCATLCRKFLELCTNHPQTIAREGQAIVDKHRKLLTYCQQVFTNDLRMESELPETAPDIISILCQKTFTQVNPSMPSSRCPYCSSLYHKDSKGQVCSTCQIGQVGLETIGVKVFTA